MVSLFIMVSWMLLLLSGFDDSVPPTGDKTFKIETRPDIVESIKIISGEKMPFWGFDIELMQNSAGYLEIMIPKNLPTPASFTNTWYSDDVPIILANGAEIDYDIIDDQCYNIYKIPISNHTKIEFTYAVILGGTWQLYSQIQFDESHPCYHEVFYEKPVDSPLKQFRTGIPTNKTQCDEGLELILRSPGGFPACVTPETKQKLIDRRLATEPMVEEGSIIDTRYPIPTIIFPQNATGHAPLSLHPLPHTTIVWLGTNSTISLINESVNRIELIIDKDNSTRQGIPARSHTIVQFAKTGFYEYVIRATESFPKSGDVVVLGENLNLLDLDERLKMAEAMVNKHLWGLLIIGFAEVSHDGLLEVTIHETEAEKIPNAKDHYLRLADEIIPFDVPISVVVDDIVMVASK